MSLFNVRGSEVETTIPYDPLNGQEFIWNKDTLTVQCNGIIFDELKNDRGEELTQDDRDWLRLDTVKPNTFSLRAYNQAVVLVKIKFSNGPSDAFNREFYMKSRTFGRVWNNFAMGIHPRLGQGSLVHELPPDVMRLIRRSYYNPNL